MASSLGGARLCFLLGFPTAWCEMCICTYIAISWEAHHNVADIAVVCDPGPHRIPSAGSELAGMGLCSLSRSSATLGYTDEIFRPKNGLLVDLSSQSMPWLVLDSVPCF